MSKKKVDYRGLSEGPLAQQLLDKQADKKWPSHRPPEALKPRSYVSVLIPGPRESVFKWVLVDGIKLLFNCLVVSASL